MHFSHEIFHITAVFNEILLAALFLHIVNLKDWKHHVEPLSSSKANTLEAESLLAQARALGKTYERSVQAAIKNDVNWLTYFPWFAGGCALLSMVLTSVDFETALSENFRISFILGLSIAGLVFALWCVAIHEKSKAVKKSEHQVIADFSPPSLDQ